MDYQLGPGPLQVDQNTIDEKIKGDIGIVENGDVATHAIPSGYYVIWKGDLYVAKTDISSGTTLSTSNLTAKPNGLGADVTALNSNIASVSTAINPLVNGNGNAVNNVDTLFTPGAGYTNAAVGLPSGSTNGTIICFKLSSGTYHQLFIPYSTATIYSRMYLGGAWTSWAGNT